MKVNLSILFIFIIVMTVIIYAMFHHICIEQTPIKTVVAQKYQYPNFPYAKEDANTVPMVYFDDKFQYNIKEYPKKRLEQYQKDLFMGMVKNVAMKIGVKVAEFSGGSYRLMKDGVEFNLFYQNEHRRVSAFLPFNEGFRMKEITIQAKEKVHIVLPLQSKLSSLSTFLDHLITKVLPVEKWITLTVVYFKDDSMIEARRLIKAKLSALPYFEWRFIPTNDTHFNRGKGIQIGVEAAAKRPSDLIFVCDVDVLFTPNFLMRCRANSIYENQVYFPVLFSLYNPELVYRLYDKEIPPISEQLTQNIDNGFWRYFGFGMFCMHRKEYDTVGGVPALLTWGGEDVIFYERFGEFSNLKIIRSIDPGIFHVFHLKNCTNVSTNSYPSCLYSKAANEGTQLHLGLVLFKMKENIDLEGLLSKRV